MLTAKGGGVEARGVLSSRQADAIYNHLGDQVVKHISYLRTASTNQFKAALNQVVSDVETALKNPSVTTLVLMNGRVWIVMIQVLFHLF